jgi:uncharacterized protein
MATTTFAKTSLRTTSRHFTLHSALAPRPHFLKTPYLSPLLLSHKPIHPVSALSTSISNYSTTSKMSTPAVTNSDAFLAAVENRRTYYALTKDIPIPDSKVKSIIETAILNLPSSFNAQSARIVLLLGSQHTYLWNDIVLKALLPHVEGDAEKKAATTGRIAGFEAGHGTAMFFEDPEPVNQLAEAFTAYADKFPQWSEHTSAIHQFVVWTALEAEGLGANLQHYNPIIDAGIQEKWGVPKEWSLKAQLVFGGKNGPAAGGVPRPQKKELSERLFVH